MGLIFSADFLVSRRSLSWLIGRACHYVLGGDASALWGHKAPLAKGISPTRLTVPEPRDHPQEDASLDAQWSEEQTKKARKLASDLAQFFEQKQTSDPEAVEAMGIVVASLIRCGRASREDAFKEVNLAVGLITEVVANELIERKSLMQGQSERADPFQGVDESIAQEDLFLERLERCTNETRRKNKVKSDLINSIQNKDLVNFSENKQKSNPLVVEAMGITIAALLKSTAISSAQPPLELFAKALVDTLEEMLTITNDEIAQGPTDGSPSA
ncbi:MAG TPA: hypothetical protein VGJ20_38775 [Xanthobacteraceae bacterium]|jgi:hypothetical protein